MDRMITTNGKDDAEALDDQSVFGAMYLDKGNVAPML